MSHESPGMNEANPPVLVALASLRSCFKVVGEHDRMPVVLMPVARLWDSATDQHRSSFFIQMRSTPSSSQIRTHPSGTILGASSWLSMFTM